MAVLYGTVLKGETNEDQVLPIRCDKDGKLPFGGTINASVGEVDLKANGATVSDANQLPVKSRLLDSTGNPITGANPLPVTFAAGLHPDQTHGVILGQNIQIPAGKKSFTISTLTGINVITIGGGTFSIGTGLDSSFSLAATELPAVRGLLPAATIAGGTWQVAYVDPLVEA